MPVPVVPVPVAVCRLLAWTGLLCLAVGTAVQAAPAYDFAYRVSGDRRVAPQQVFDDGSTTYIQYYPGQVLPALLATSPDGGQRLLHHTQLGPYVTVAGTHGALIAQLGSVRAVIDYAGQAPRMPDAAVTLAPPVTLAPAQTDVASWTALPAIAPSQTPASTPMFTQPAAVPIPATVIAPAPVEPPARILDVTLADQNLRRVLTRWAEESGWIFRAEHWTPDVDIAISARASFSSDFKSSVRALLAGTELSSRPLQPCFYANQVLRVVPQAERCDRRVAH